MRIKGYTQITWSKICLTNEYYTKTDFLQEKIIFFIALQCSGEEQSRENVSVLTDIDRALKIKKNYV